MDERQSSIGLRVAAAIALIVGFLPLGLTWLMAGRPAGEPADATVPASQVDPTWINLHEIDVQLKSGTDSGALNSLAATVSGSASWNTGSISDGETRIANILLPQGLSPELALSRIRSDARVEAADFSHIYRIPTGELSPAHSNATKKPDSDSGSFAWRPDDPRYEEQWNLRMVHAEEAWQKSHGKGAIVAVIDTGVAYKDTKKGKQARDFGKTQFVPGYDFVNKDALPNDDQGHGTHVAGTIAESTNNGEGVAGLAFEAKIMPLKVLDSFGTGSSKNIAEAIRWAANHGANVINMSLGSPYPDQLMGAACTYAKKKGVTIVCAAGNSGKEGVGYPAAYKDCIAVSAVGPSGDLSFYSSWGRQVAIAAPGGDKNSGGETGGILQNSVMPDGAGAMVDDYYWFQGTSMATPHVAAAAALIVSEGVKNPDDVRAVLAKTAEKKGPAKKYGAGVLNAGRAATLAANRYGDAVSRFWMVVGIFALCMFRSSRGKSAAPAKGSSSFWCAAALSFGILFPDWLTGYVGGSSPLNIIGHSVLVPGMLLLLGARNNERRMLGWMALGFITHTGWEFLRGTSPFGPEVGALQLLPWLGVNIAVGCGMLIAGLTAPRD